MVLPDLLPRSLFGPYRTEDDVKASRHEEAQSVDAMTTGVNEEVGEGEGARCKHVYSWAVEVCSP